MKTCSLMLVNTGKTKYMEGMIVNEHITVKQNTDLKQKMHVIIQT